VRRRLRNAAFADIDARLGGQDNVSDTELLPFGQHFAGLVAKTRLSAPLRECFPKFIGEKTHQDMGLDAFGFLAPDGADAQVALVDAEGGFCFGQLDRGTPKVFGAPVLDVAAQQVTPFVEFGPDPPLSSLPSSHAGPAIGTGIDHDLKKAGRPAVEPFDASDAFANAQRVLLIMRACVRALLPTYPGVSGEAFVHGLFFFAPVGATA